MDEFDGGCAGQGAVGWHVEQCRTLEDEEWTQSFAAAECGMAHRCNEARGNARHAWFAQQLFELIFNQFTILAKLLCKIHRGVALELRARAGDNEFLSNTRQAARGLARETKAAGCQGRMHDRKLTACVEDSGLKASTEPLEETALPGQSSPPHEAARHDLVARLSRVAVSQAALSGPGPQTDDADPFAADLPDAGPVGVDQPIANADPGSGVGESCITSLPSVAAEAFPFATWSSFSNRASWQEETPDALSASEGPLVETRMPETASIAERPGAAEPAPADTSKPDSVMEPGEDLASYAASAEQIGFAAPTPTPDPDPRPDSVPEPELRGTSASERPNPPEDPSEHQPETEAEKSHQVGPSGHTAEAELSAPARPSYYATSATAEIPEVCPPPTLGIPEARPGARVRSWTVLRILSTAARFAVLGLAVWFAAMALLIVLFRFVDPPTTALMLIRSAQGVDIDQRWVPLDKISPALVHAVITSEDGRFCSHWGIDPQEVVAAISRSARGRPRGASTMTMQLAKNLFLWPQQSYVRKALEVPLTLAIDAVWPKSRIAEVYLNVVEWGPGIFGAEAAARRHFNRSAQKLTTQQAALLAVALPSPIHRKPGSPSRLMNKMASTIMARMRASPGVDDCVVNPL